MRVILSFRNYLRSVKVLQRFIRRSCNRCRLLKEAVLASWRLKEEKKLVAERERLLSNKHMTVLQKQFVLMETDQMSTPTPDRVKRATVKLLWRERSQRFLQAWRAYHSEERVKRLSNHRLLPGRKAPPLPLPQFEFSPRDFPLAVLEREATMTQLVELDPKFGDLDATPSDHRRRQPQRRWAVSPRLDHSACLVWQTSAKTEKVPLFNAVDPRKLGRERSLPWDKDGERDRLQPGTSTPMRRSSPREGHIGSTSPNGPLSRWASICLEDTEDSCEDDPERETAIAPSPSLPLPRVRSPDRMEPRDAAALPALHPGTLATRSSITALHASPLKPRLAKNTNRPNIRRMSSTMALSPDVPVHRSISNGGKPGFPLSSLSRSSTPGAV
eukprot:GGOE01004115.1.p2 GENE.GGOE01004115.1~~GGOE01004115.1.p2  ORF type:complete len:386 (-),score=95.91 GGOE01004115.1:1205-2362(-)